LSSSAFPILSAFLSSCACAVLSFLFWAEYFCISHSVSYSSELSSFAFPIQSAFLLSCVVLHFPFSQLLFWAEYFLKISQILNLPAVNLLEDLPYRVTSWVLASHTVSVAILSACLLLF
jgi:hypothetical protein